MEGKDKEAGREYSDPDNMHKIKWGLTSLTSHVGAWSLGGARVRRYCGD